MLEKKKIKVHKIDLETLASFECEHVVFNNDPEQHCDKHPERGGCCNACWARRMAEQYLKKKGTIQKKDENKTIKT